MPLLILLFLLIVKPAAADVVVIYDDVTKDIYSVSDKDDAIIPSGYKKSTLPGTAEDYKDAKDYQLVNGRLKINVEKIKERDEITKRFSDKQIELDAVNKMARKTAYEQLKADGYKFTVLTDKDFE